MAKKEPEKDPSRESLSHAFISGDDWARKTSAGLVLKAHNELVDYCQALEKRVKQLEEQLGRGAP